MENEDPEFQKAAKVLEEKLGGKFVEVAPGEYELRKGDSDVSSSEPESNSGTQTFL